MVYGAGEACARGGGSGGLMHPGNEGVDVGMPV